MKSAIELGPAVVARIAAWPIELLAPFGHNPELTEAAARATSKSREEWNRYLAAYDAVVERERTALWQRTLQDPEFAKALTIAAPWFTSRASAFGPESKRTKAVRHAEIRLYRYLARAVGRTEPCDLWAGVAIAPWCSETSVRTVSPRRRFVPDLRPFQCILRTLSRLRSYRATALFRTNPTLEREPLGSWIFAARTPETGVVKRRVGPHDGVDRLLSASVGRPPSKGADLAAKLAEGEDDDPADGWDVLDTLIDAGVFVGGLDLPPRFECPWQALRAAAVFLDSGHEPPWSAAAGALQDIARELEDSYDAFTPELLASRLADAVEVVRVLFRALNCCPNDLPRTVLRCDLRAPFDLRLGSEIRSHVSSALDSYLRSRDSAHPAQRIRESARRQFGEWLGEEGRRILELCAETPPDSRLLTWQQLAEATNTIVDTASLQQSTLSGDDDIILPERDGDGQAHGSPIGTLLAGAYCASGADPVSLSVHGVFDEITPLFARFAGLLDESGLPLTGWVRSRLEELGRRHDIQIVELLAPCEFNPNALARPRFCGTTIELWGACGSPDVMTTSSARIVFDHRTQNPFLRLRCSSHDIAVASFAAANIAAGDPVARALLRTGFRDLPHANFRSSQVCYDREIQEPAFAPRLRLRDGSLVRGRRTFVSEERLHPLLRSSGAGRFALWISLVHEYDWPLLVNARRNGGPALLVPTDSPIAVEALFHGMRNEPGPLLIEEFAGTPWLSDSAGRHYALELAVPFVCSEHWWSARNVEVLRANS